MSKLFEALSDLKREQLAVEDVAALVKAQSTVIVATPKQDSQPEHQPLKVVQATARPLELVHTEPPQEAAEVDGVERQPAETADASGSLVSASPESRLVALTDPNSLGAEKFRALVTRFDHLRSQRQLKSFQVTSSMINEGKTLVAGNVAVTFAKYSGAKTLLVEGDLHRPTLARLFGLSELRGLNQWWYGEDQELHKFVHRLTGMQLSFLPAGMSCDQPSNILRSSRFAKAFAQLASQFEWIVVDSTPMLPIVDVNLWSKLLDGTLLVVREGVTPIKALQRGLHALNHPKLIGVVVNEATELDQASYPGKYYSRSDTRETSAKNK